MKISAGLHFNGQCEEAFHFYQNALEGKIDLVLHWGDTPMADQVPQDWQGKIMFARLSLGDGELLGSDVLLKDYRSPQGFSVLLSLDDPLLAEQRFKRLSAGGVIKLPLQQTFWSRRYGVLEDRFGITWDVNCQLPPE